MSARIRENSGLQNELSSAPHAGFNNSQAGVLYIYNSVKETNDIQFLLGILSDCLFHGIKINRFLNSRSTFKAGFEQQALYLYKFIKTVNHIIMLSHSKHYSTDDHCSLIKNLLSIVC